MLLGLGDVCWNVRILEDKQLIINQCTQSTQLAFAINFYFGQNLTCSGFVWLFFTKDFKLPHARSDNMGQLC